MWQCEVINKHLVNCGILWKPKRLIDLILPSTDGEIVLSTLLGFYWRILYKFWIFQKLAWANGTAAVAQFKSPNNEARSQSATSRPARSFYMSSTTLFFVSVRAKCTVSLSGVSRSPLLVSIWLTRHLWPTLLDIGVHDENIIQINNQSDAPFPQEGQNGFEKISEYSRCGRQTKEQTSELKNPLFLFWTKRRCDGCKVTVKYASERPSLAKHSFARTTLLTVCPPY